MDDALVCTGQLPASPAKWQLQTVLLVQKGGAEALAKAQKILERWCRRDRQNPDPRMRMIELFLFSGDHAHAGTASAAFLAQFKSHPLAHYYRAVALQLTGDMQAAREHYRTAIVRHSEHKLTDAELALEVAIECFETAAGEHPGSKGGNELALINAEDLYRDLNRVLADWRRADTKTLRAAQMTRYGNAAYNLGCADLFRYDRLTQAGRHFLAAAEIDPQHLLARTNQVFALNYQPRFSPADIADSHRRFGRALRDRLGAAAADFDNRRDPDRRLRIAYLSSDFRKHSVAHFITPVVAHHDPAEYEIHAYYNARKQDDWTRLIASHVRRFTGVAEDSDDQLAARIRADRIDILIDLNGLSKGHRIAVLASRAAPLQMTWLGYPATTGLDSVDFRIVDELTDPGPDADALHTEKLLRLSGPFSVYRPPADVPLPAEKTAADRHSHITFGSFNHILKLNPALFDCWARILEQVPDSRLIVKSLLAGESVNRRDLGEALTASGIDPQRIEIIGRLKSAQEHFSVYRRVDIALDSFPYNGTTTTCDTLYMGVPVVALAGQSHAGRVSLSQLHRIGLDRLVANSPAGYIETAVKLASDRALLNNVRSNLRQRMQQSPLMDYAAFTKGLESRLRAVWRDWCRR